MAKSVCFQENEPICCLCCENLFSLFSPRVAALSSGDERLVDVRTILSITQSAVIFFFFLKL